MNLQTASKFEINKAVAESFGYIVKPQIGKQDFVFIENPDFDIGHEGVDYCNQWEDAGSIIHNYKIDLIHDRNEGKVTAGSIIPGSENKRYDFKFTNENPLVAAMVVYLMIKGK